MFQERGGEIIEGGLWPSKKLWLESSWKFILNVHFCSAFVGKLFEEQLLGAFEKSYKNMYFVECLKKHFALLKQLKNS